VKVSKEPLPNPLLGQGEGTEGIVSVSQSSPVASDAQADKVENAIRRLLGAERVRQPRGREAMAARIIAEPHHSDEIAALVRQCESERITLAPLGAARTLGEIRRTPVMLGISLARMNRIVAYEPEDLTVIVEAGMTLGALNQRLGERGQRLPLDPRNPGATTLGALIGASQAGPLRLSEGTPRDLLIGVRFVGHGGVAVHGGGRVVKNVAGYDLMKVMTGSFGTLGIITEAAFKLRPIPEGYTMGVAPFARAADAFGAALELHDALPLVHAEVLSPALAARFGHPGAFLLLAAIAGSASELEYQRGHFGALGSAAFSDGASAIETYEQLRDLEFAPAAIAAQLATAPAELGRCVESLGAEFRAHAACGIAQVFAGGEPDPAKARATLDRWRAAARAAHGHLRLLAAAPALRSHLEFFDQPAAGALKLMRRLKAAFDPAGVFNPGCFVGGI
jgi:glycolate oxidase FAD binding subunit